MSSPAPNSDAGWGAPLERALSALGRHLWKNAFGEALALAGPTLIFVGGGWILLARFGLGMEIQAALWGLGVVLLAVPFAVWRAQRAVPDDRALVAMLDRESGGTGALVTQYELRDARWQSQAASVWNAARPERREAQLGNGMWGSFFALLFVGLAIWFAPPAPASGLPIGLLNGALSRLTSELEDLEEVGALDPERQAEWGERLKDIAENLDAGGLEQAFEAMDRFRDDLERLANEHADTLAQLREAALNAAEGHREELLNALQKALSNPATQELVQNLMKELGRMDGESAMSQMDPQALQSMLEQLGGSQGLEGLSAKMAEQLAKRMGDMAARGWLDQQALAEALKRRMSPKSLRDTKSKHAADCEIHNGGFCTGAATGECETPGAVAAGVSSGGVGKGPGAAEMSYGEGSDLDDSLFESELLNGQAVPDASAVLDVQYSAPDVDATGQAAGLVDVSASAGSVTWKRRLSPTQREAVRRFFTPSND